MEKNQTRPYYGLYEIVATQIKPRITHISFSLAVHVKRRILHDLLSGTTGIDFGVTWFTLNNIATIYPWERIDLWRGNALKATTALPGLWLEAKSQDCEWPRGEAFFLQRMESDFVFAQFAFSQKPKSCQQSATNGTNDSKCNTDLAAWEQGEEESHLVLALEVFGN